MAVAVIVSMAAILVHERTRTLEIAVKSDEFRTVGRNITAVHREITGIAIFTPTTGSGTGHSPSGRWPVASRQQVFPSHRAFGVSAG